MAQPSTQDTQKPFDPTGYPTVSGSQLGQLIDGLAPYIDKGLVVSTTDVASVPQVPDADTNTKWREYVWRRIMASSVSVYVWNPAAASDATYLQWQQINASSIADLSVTNAKLAAGAVTDDKVTSISYSKITGTPTGLAPTGAAGGDLTGTYPNPTVAANTIDSSKLKSDAGIDGNRAVGTNHIKDSAVTTGVPGKIAKGTALQILQTNVGATGTEWATKLLTQLDEPIAGDGLKLVRVKSDLSGYELASNAAVQRVVKAIAATSTGTTIDYDNTIPQNTEGVSLTTLAFQAKSATSILKFTFTAFVSHSTNAGRVIVALFNASADALYATVSETPDGANDATSIKVEFYMASPGTAPVTYDLRWGRDTATAGTAYLNRDETTALFGGVAVSYFAIEEFFGTLS